MNNIITNLVNRLELTGKAGDPKGIQLGANQQQPLLANPIGQRVGSNTATFLDPSRLKQNLQQLSQQFSSAISAAQQQRKMQQQQPQLGLQKNS